MFSMVTRLWYRTKNIHFEKQISFYNFFWEDSLKNKEKKSSKSKKKKISREVMKKAKMGNVTLKGDLHGFLKALGSVLSNVLKKPGRRKYKLMPFYLDARSCLLTFSQFQSKNWWGYVWCCLNWSYKNTWLFFVQLIKENILVISMPYLKQECWKV